MLAVLLTSLGELSKFLLVFIIFIPVIFFAPILQGKGSWVPGAISKLNLRFAEIFVVGSFVSCLLWYVFLKLSPWIWSIHPQINASEINPCLRWALQPSDGIESFVLYVLMFINIILSVATVSMLQAVKPNKRVYFVFSAILIAVSCYYFFSIGLNRPSGPSVHSNIILPIIITAGAAALCFVDKKNRLVSSLVILLLIGFTSFFPEGGTSLPDIEYIFGPALRLFYGFKVADIYFQYDMFLSYLALGWMKLHLQLEWFAFLGQVSYFLFFSGCFWFSTRYFQNRWLPVYFILSLLLIRFY